MSLEKDKDLDQSAGEGAPDNPEAGANGSDQSDATAPWPLATDATIKVLAWPRYDDLESIKRVLQVAEPLFDNRSGVLILRYDPELDIPYAEASGQLQRAFEAMGLKGDLKILMVDDVMTRTDWPRLGQTVTCVLKLDPTNDEVHDSFCSAMGVEIISGVAPIEEKH